MAIEEQVTINRYDEDQSDTSDTSDTSGARRAI